MTSDLSKNEIEKLKNTIAIVLFAFSALALMLIGLFIGWLIWA